MIDQEKEINPVVDLEETPEFKNWVTLKLQECSEYVYRSFRKVLPPERMMFFLTESGFPDPDLQQKAHARIWGYNYQIEPGITAINPANGKPMIYTVWKKLLPDPTDSTVEAPDSVVSTAE